LTSDAVIDYTLLMITDRAVLLAVRRAPCGHTSVESFIAAHGVTKCRPSLRIKAYTLNPYDVRKTKTCGNTSGKGGSRRQKFEPAFLLR
jgi:hypothetical protein